MLLGMLKSNPAHFLSISCVDVQQNDDLGASVGLENDDDLFLWNVTFEGPENSLYEVSFGHTFFLLCKMPLDVI